MRKLEDLILNLRVTLLSAILFVFLAAPAYAVTVTLAWNANTQTDLAGYKLYYRKGLPGPPYDGSGAAEGDSPILIPLASLADSNSPDYTVTIPSGTELWSFVVTAYAKDGLESAYSNQILFSDPPISLITFPADQSMLNTISSIDGLSSTNSCCDIKYTQIMVTDGSNYLQSSGTWTTTLQWFTVDSVTASAWTHDVSGATFASNTTRSITSEFLLNPCSVAYTAFAETLSFTKRFILIPFRSRSAFRTFRRGNPSSMRQSKACRFFGTSLWPNIFLNNFICLNPESV